MQWWHFLKVSPLSYTLTVNEAKQSKRSLPYVKSCRNIKSTYRITNLAWQNRWILLIYCQLPLKTFIWIVLLSCCKYEHTDLQLYRWYQWMVSRTSSLKMTLRSHPWIMLVLTLDFSPSLIIIMKLNWPFLSCTIDNKTNLHIFNNVSEC